MSAKEKSWNGDENGHSKYFIPEKAALSGNLKQCKSRQVEFIV